MIRVLITGTLLILSLSLLSQSQDNASLIRHSHLTVFTSQLYVFPMDQVVNHSEKSLRFKIQEAQFNDNTKYTLIYADEFQNRKIFFNFYVSDGIIDSCVFEGSKPLVYNFFVGYWPGVGDAGTILKDDHVKLYYRNDMITYSELDSLSAKIVITPISL